MRWDLKKDSVYKQFKRDILHSIIRIVALFIILIYCVSCQKNDKVENVERAFYYWKDTDFDNDVIKQVNKLKVQKFYIKLFEVDYSESRGNYPYCKFKPSEYILKEIDSIKIIPTVFIKNEIFQFNDEKSIDKLADNIVFLINKYLSEDNSNDKKEKIFKYDEIQIDCDWTKSTKDKYFYLLNKIKFLSKKKMSCTLRLYPYKYPDIMGVPPVDKATLMCYNLINPLSQQNKNSILDISELKKYLITKNSYPVHLDVALPTYYWTQLYQNNRFVELIDISSNEIKSFTKSVKPLWYQVTKDTLIKYNLYLKTGDMLKCEDVSVHTLNEAIEIIKKQVLFDKNITVSLFDLDNSTFNQYSNEEISNFYSSFTK